MAAGVFTLGACNKIESGNEPLADSDVQQIVLQVANGGDGIATRAGRPMYGSEAQQTIENVKVIVCNSQPTNNVVSVFDIKDWNTSATDYITTGHGKEKVIELTGDNRLMETGTYKAYAIGYHNSSDYTNITEAVTNIAQGGTFNENLKLTMNQAAGNKIGEEIFAGSLEIQFVAGKGFKSSLILNRQVAGTFGYVEDIPYKDGATNLKLVSSARNSALVLGHFANDQLPDNGGNNSKNKVNYVINGDTQVNDKVLFDIKLSDWFTEIKEGANGMLDIATWKNPHEGEATFKKGSIFGGNFVIPFAKTSENTLKLQLTNAGGSVLREWIVKLPFNDKQVSQHDLFTWGTNFAQSNNTDSQKVYNIVRNHIYGIGTRTLDKPEFPEPGPGPEPEVDKPESLNTKQEIVLQVNDNWEVIHSMELE